MMALAYQKQSPLEGKNGGGGGERGNALFTQLWLLQFHIGKGPDNFVIGNDKTYWKSHERDFN